jgi:hypothetical protein
MAVVSDAADFADTIERAVFAQDFSLAHFAWISGHCFAPCEARLEWRRK